MNGCLWRGALDPDVAVAALVPKFILLHVDTQLFGHPLLKRLLFPPSNCLGTLVKNQLTANVRVSF